MRIVRTDRGNECSGSDVFLADEKFGGGCAGNAEIAVLDRARQIANRFDVDLEVARKFRSEICRDPIVQIERMDFFQLKN